MKDFEDKLNELLELPTNIVEKPAPERIKV